MSLSYPSGDEVYANIVKHIRGRIATRPREAALLYETIEPGDLYLEVGCLWGGTAILAAHKADRVITIDFMRGGYWETGDPLAGPAHRAASAKKKDHFWMGTT